ncbi:MAG TPA: tetratricopeptide repeat protein [Bacteroidota bacterium]|nr:tetratricopeptide repeat protein [Bacteroidota bacterium]HXY55066.1 tetratricopeptide repeat protein [Nitrospirota bacterium]
MGKSLWVSVFIILLLPYGPSYASDMRSPVREYRDANKLFAAGRYRDAIPLYRLVLASHPEQVPLGDVYTRIGDSYFRLGEYKNALPAYRSALESQKDAERPSTQYWIAFCYFLMGNDAEAAAEFLRIPERYPSSGMWVGTAYYWAGRASERRGRIEDAAEYYRKAGGNGRSTQGLFALRKAEAIKKQ